MISACNAGIVACLGLDGEGACCAGRRRFDILTGDGRRGVGLVISARNAGIVACVGLDGESACCATRGRLDILTGDAGRDRFDMLTGDEREMVRCAWGASAICDGRCGVGSRSRGDLLNPVGPFWPWSVGNDALPQEAFKPSGTFRRPFSGEKRKTEYCAWGGTTCCGGCGVGSIRRGGSVDPVLPL